MDNLQTPKGFRDFLPLDARKRRFVLKSVTAIFEKYGFLPLETPALEYAEILKGKYGEDEKLIYEFTDHGGRQVALRYDQTVPLARVMAQYPSLPKPFKRYQTQPVWRAENTQKGRYREFLQCDIDTVGTSSLLADAEIIATALEAAAKLGLKDLVLYLNDRALFAGLETKYVIAIDKLEKIGKDGVLKELTGKGLGKKEAEILLDKIVTAKPTPLVEEILTILKKFNVSYPIQFKSTLARGLNYYTGSIFELAPKEGGNSIGGGGRYDNLIGMFSRQSLPAVGFAFGFDRMIELMDTQNLFENLEDITMLVTVFNPDLLSKSLEVTSKLRSSGITTEIYLEPNAKLEKQLKYADLKGFTFALILGPEELATESVKVKDLKTKDQKLVKIADLPSYSKK